MLALASPASLKGVLAAAGAAEALGEGMRDGGATVELAPVADGGEGTTDVLHAVLGGEWLEAEVRRRLRRGARCPLARAPGRHGGRRGGSCGPVRPCAARPARRVEPRLRGARPARARRGAAHARALPRRHRDDGRRHRSARVALRPAVRHGRALRRAHDAVGGATRLRASEGGLARRRRRARAAVRAAGGARSVRGARGLRCGRRARRGGRRARRGTRPGRRLAARGDRLPGAAPSRRPRRHGRGPRRRVDARRQGAGEGCGRSPGGERALRRLRRARRGAVPGRRDGRALRRPGRGRARPPRRSGATWSPGAPRRYCA